MFFRNNKAFTLIELLITVSIILLLAVLSIPAFNQFAANNELATKAEEIQSLIEKTYYSGMSPPPGANCAHLWINNPESNGQKSIISKADNAIEWVPSSTPNDNPTDMDFALEKTILPTYIHLQDGDNRIDLTYCEARSPSEFTCLNTVKETPWTNLTLSSDKTSTTYKIEILDSPFRVSVTKI